MGSLGDDLDRLGLLERREQILAERHTKAKQKREKCEREVYERMIDEGWKPNESGFNRNGFKFRPRETIFAVVQDASRLKHWLRNQEGDDLADAGIVEDKFKKADLNRIARRKLDEGAPMPPGMGYTVKTAVGKSGIMGHNNQEEDTDGE